LSQEADLADVRRVLDGDPEAFEGIVRRWQRPLLNLAYRYCRDRAKAEDMVQEAFLRVFRKLDQFEATAAFSTWLFAVATRLYISHMRGWSPQWVGEDEMDRLPQWVRVADALEARDEQEIVRQAVARLPRKYRDAVILYYFLDKDVQETARILGLATGTLKSRLHRGRELLRRRLSARLLPQPTAKEA